MNRIAHHFCVGALALGLPAMMSACSSGASETQIEQVSADAQRAAEAADRAAQEAERASAAAQEAADAAAAATAAAEKSDRIAQQGLRK